MAECFGRVLRDARTKAKLSQEALALNASVDRTFVSKSERGKNQPSLNIVFALAKALNVPAAELVARTDELMDKTG